MAKRSETKILSKLPAKDIRWVHYIDAQGCEWFATSKPDRSLYFLYRKGKDGYELVSKASSPVDFNELVYPPEPEVKPKRKKKGG